MQPIFRQAIGLKGDAQTFNRFPFGPTWSLTMMSLTMMSKGVIVNTEETNPHSTAMIVSSYVRHHTLRPEQLSDLITTVHHALGQLGQPVQAEEVLTPAVSVRRSVHQDYVVCLDCGYRGKMLQRHLSTRHGLNRDECVRRWGLRSDHPLTAPAYSERRSTMAKSFGFG